MIIPIIKNNIHNLLLGVTLLLSVGISVAFQAKPTSKPQIKIKERRKVQIDSASHQTLIKHSRTKYNINGKIIEYAEFSETPEGAPILKNLKIHKYNTDGLLIGTMIYNENNALIQSTEKKYNYKEQITKITQTTYSNQTPKKTFTHLEYNQQGKVVLSKTFNQRQKKISETKRSFSDNGELTEEQEWSYIQKEGKQIKHAISTENQYNDKGEIIHSIRQEQLGRTKIREVKRFENNAIVSWTKFKNGKLISHFKNKKKDTFSIQHEYVIPPPIQDNFPVLEYDDAKRDPLQNISHKAYRTITIKSNQQRQPIKKVTREYQQVIEVVYYYYNPKGLLTKEKVFNKETQGEQTYIYQYDEHENIIQNSIYKNNQLIERISYNYEYYNH